MSCVVPFVTVISNKQTNVYKTKRGFAKLHHISGIISGITTTVKEDDEKREREREREVRCAIDNKISCLINEKCRKTF